jgi:sensor histidine kinase YesM
MVENIFKHGNLTEKNHGAIVKIYNQDGMLFIETDNLINNQIRPGGNHKGISNTEQRLKYAYGEDIVFSYKATESNHFIVRLGIPADLLMPPVSPLKALPGIDK